MKEEKFKKFLENFLNFVKFWVDFFEKTAFLREILVQKVKLSLEFFWRKIHALGVNFRRSFGKSVNFYIKFTQML